MHRLVTRFNEPQNTLRGAIELTWVKNPSHRVHRKIRPSATKVCEDGTSLCRRPAATAHPRTIPTVASATRVVIVGKIRECKVAWTQALYACHALVNAGRKIVTDHPQPYRIVVGSRLEVPVAFRRRARLVHWAGLARCVDAVLLAIWINGAY